jgi:hypothetical protein
MNRQIVSFVFKVYIALFIIFIPKVKMILEHYEIILLYVIFVLNLIVLYFILAKIYNRKLSLIEKTKRTLYILFFTSCSYTIEIIIRNNESTISILSVLALFLLSYPIVKEYLFTKINQST